MFIQRFFFVHFRGEEGASGDGGQEPTLICKKKTYAKSVGCLVGEV